MGWKRDNCSLYILIISGFFFVSVPSANEPVRITVHAGGKQTFEGMGVNTHVDPVSKFVDLPASARNDILELLHGNRGARMKYTRVWTHSDRDEDIKFFATANSPVINEAQRVRESYGDSLVIQLIPTGTIGEPLAYASSLAHRILKMRRDYNMNITWTGISNEPNAGEVGMRPEMVPVIVKALRDTLDALDPDNACGCRDVRILAPECSNSDDIAWAMIDALIRDSDALEALDGFALHSYNMCMRPDWRDDLAGYTAPGATFNPKKLWQTESSNTLQPEDWNDSAKGAESAARFLNDVNLGVSVWMYWIGFALYSATDNGSYIINVNPTTGAYRPFLKYYYLRQAAHTFDPGAVFRTSSCDLGDELFLYWMTNWYGVKTPVNAAAALNPDGTWGLAVVNITGIPSRGPETTFREAAVYDVTFFVEELAGAPDRTYRVMRCNDGTRNVFDRDELLMHNGEVTVTVGPCDMVSLRPGFNPDFYPVRGFAPYEVQSRCGDCGMDFGLAFIPCAGARWLSRRRRKRLTVSRRSPH